VADLREDVTETRRTLERETITAPSLDAAVARAEGRLEGLPESETEPVVVETPVHAWRLGDRARSRTGGWEGRIAALERGGQRATLEAGGMRVSVDTSDLEVAAPVSTGRGGGGAAGGESTSSLSLDRARSVASSLDLRGARVDEALEALDRYLDDASLAGLDKVLIIHGSGTGALRDAVRTEAGSHPLVKGVRAGERGEGGDGASIITL
jgi:DNA mismatch repair protein MutS2